MSNVLKLPKKGVQAPTVGLRGANMAVKGCQFDTLSRGIPSQEVDSNPVSPPSASDRALTVGEIISGEKRSAYSKPPQNRPLGYEQSWAEGWKEGGYKGVSPAFTRKVGGMLKKAMANWPARSGDRHEFIRWCVVNWSAACAAHMRWMKDSPPPAIPEPMFFARFIRYFAVAWADRDNVKWQGTAPGTRQQIDALKRTGMSEEAAILEAAKQQALSEDRKQRAAQLRSAETTLKMAQAAAARSATRFTKENPHPRSAENQPLDLKAPPTDVMLDLPSLPEFPDD